MYNEEIYKLILNGISKENILVNEPMKKHTSFKIGGNAEFFVKANDLEEIKYILKICKENNISLTIVGNGSNLLVKDNGIKGIVLKLNLDDIKIRRIEKDDCLESLKKTSFFNESKIEQYAIVTVGAGVQLARLAQILLKEGISGLEFASGIPGTIGGAIKMNAGAYGKEFKDIVIETTCIDMDGNVFKLNNLEQQFEYRSSIFKKEKYIVLQTKLLFEYVDNIEVIYNKMQEYKINRLEKQPIEYHSAGSTFKRGNDFITAELIDKCGLKGYSIGDAQVSIKHAGFVINVGNATADDVLKLIEYIKEKVYEKYKKVIELEIEIVGN